MSVPSDLDLTTPSPARMYDYYLGGKDHFSADRAAAEKALTAVPDGRKIALDNRKFLVRSVQYLAEKGIDQFLDLGTGIPTSPNVHEVAQKVNPAVKVAYVDNDPIVVVHGKALLAGQGDHVTVVRGDIRYPANILANHSVCELIDFSRPVGILIVAVLHFVPDADNAHSAVEKFRERMAPGSYMVLSHVCSDEVAPETLEAISEAYRNASAPAVLRAKNDIQRFFNGFDLMRPGLVEVAKWRPETDGYADGPRAALRCLGGIGRK